MSRRAAAFLRGDGRWVRTGRSFHVALFGAFALACWTTIALADAAPDVVFRGGVPSPGDTTQVEMTEEWVRITNVRKVTPEHRGISGDYLWLADVKAEFLFTNRGTEDEHVQMFFPLCSSLFDSSVSCLIADAQVHVSIDGRALPFTVEVRGPVTDNGYDEWPRVMRFEATFPAGAARRLVVDYVTADAGGKVYPAHIGFSYLLHTGAGWLGPIGRGTVTVRAPFEATPANVVIANGTSSFSTSRECPVILPAIYRGGMLEYAFERLEPTTADDLHIAIALPEYQDALAVSRTRAEAAATKLDYATAASMMPMPVPDALATAESVIEETLPKLIAEDRALLARTKRVVDRLLFYGYEYGCTPFALHNVDAAIQLWLVQRRPDDVARALGTCFHLPDDFCEPTSEDEAPPAAVIRAYWVACLLGGVEGWSCPELLAGTTRRIASRPESERLAFATCRLGLPERQVRGVLQGLAWDTVPERVGEHPVIARLRDAFRERFESLATLDRTRSEDDGYGCDILKPIEPSLPPAPTDPPATFPSPPVQPHVESTASAEPAAAESSSRRDAPSVVWLLLLALGIGALLVATRRHRQ